MEHYQKLLNEFEKLPKSNNSPTFMDICQMTGDRFEERCSQVLRFYLNPMGQHKLYGLFLNSLLELLDLPECRYNLQTVRVITEDTTDDNKRIDITVVADDFVIAIENKIGAELYNPLDSYVKHIQSHYKEKERKVFVVLSARKITDCREVKKMQVHGYKYINYQMLFSVIKSNLGTYATDCNQTYLTFLFDFIRTIEKRYYNSNMEIKRFFFNNRNSIDNLIYEYNAFKEDILKTQKENIADLRINVSQKTGADWWAYQGWDLGISFNEDTNRIGIESSFSDETFDNQLGDFHIYITVWNKKHFYPYEEELKRLFPDCPIDYESVNNRVYLHLPVITGNDHEEIASRLSEYYFIMKDVTERIK